MRDLSKIPDNLPIPKNDGACDHLEGIVVPNIQLLSTANRWVDLKIQSQKPTVIFFYPRTGEPSKPATAGWDLIPGARGCTPQSCSFRDTFKQFQDLGIEVFGASSQTQEYQQEFVKRNHIPFEILSDVDFKLTDALKLPTFTYNSMKLIKRLAFFCDKEKIVKVFYPVFPPNENAKTVLSWLTHKS